MFSSDRWTGDLDALVSLGTLLSGDNQTVRSALALIVDAARGDDNARRAAEGEVVELLGPDRRGAPLEVDWYDPANAVATVLQHAGALVWVDHKQEADDVMLQLDRLSGGRLASSATYRRIFPEASQHPVGLFIEEERLPEFHQLASEVDSILECIDTGGDDYAIVLIPAEQEQRVRELAQAADVGLYLDMWAKRRAEASSRLDAQEVDSPKRRRGFRWGRRKRS